MVGFFAMRSLPEDSEIPLDDLMQTSKSAMLSIANDNKSHMLLLEVTEQAESNGEVLGKRMGDFIEVALHRLVSRQRILHAPLSMNTVYVSPGTGLSLICLKTRTAI